MSDQEVTIKVPAGSTVVVSNEAEDSKQNKEEQKQSGPQILTEDLPLGYAE